MKQPVLSVHDASAIYSLLWARSVPAEAGVPAVYVDISASPNRTLARLDLKSRTVVLIHDGVEHEYPSLSEFAYHNAVPLGAASRLGGKGARELDETRARHSALRLFLMDRCAGYVDYLKLSARAHEAITYRGGSTNLGSILRAERDAAAEAISERRTAHAREFYHLWDNDRKAVNQYINERNKQFRAL